MVKSSPVVVCSVVSYVADGTDDCLIVVVVSLFVVSSVVTGSAATQ